MKAKRRKRDKSRQECTHQTTFMEFMRQAGSYAYEARKLTIANTNESVDLIDWHSSVPG